MEFWNNLGDNPERTMIVAEHAADSFREEYGQRKDINYLREQCVGLKARAKNLEAHYQQLREAERICFVDRMGNCARQLQETERILNQPSCTIEGWSPVFASLGFVYAEVTGMERSLEVPI